MVGVSYNVYIYSLEIAASSLIGRQLTTGHTRILQVSVTVCVCARVCVNVLFAFNCKCICSSWIIALLKGRMTLKHQALRHLPEIYIFNYCYFPVFSILLCIVINIYIATLNLLSGFEIFAESPDTLFLQNNYLPPVRFFTNNQTYTNTSRCNFISRKTNKI